jgi:hypothetical protein
MARLCSADSLFHGHALLLPVALLCCSMLCRFARFASASFVTDCHVVSC